MLTCSLNSGSNGNCIYVEAADTRLLFDAGISAAEAQRRLRRLGRDVRGVTALVVSHEHADHIRGMGVFQRRFGMPIYATPLTLSANACPLGKLNDVRFFMSGGTLEFGPVRVHTIPTPHDARDPLCFVVEHEGRRLGILTDLGHPFPGLGRLLAGLDAAYLESNYDPQMLAAGPYPERLKQRIRGPRGHLSNDDAATLAASAPGPRLAWLAAAHLSEQNNTPELAVDCLRRRAGRYLDVRLAARDAASDLWTV